MSAPTWICHACNKVLLWKCLFLQGLKYSFQTHDRLCFVMEYANGGEVNLCRSIWLVFNLRLFRCDVLIASFCFPSAFLPSVKGPGVLGGAGEVLRCRDRVGSGLPACWKKCGVSWSEGKRAAGVLGALSFQSFLSFLSYSPSSLPLHFYTGRL